MSKSKTEMPIIPTLKNNPCYKCTERKVGCHTKCDKYKEFKEKLSELRDKERVFRTYRSARTINRYTNK